MKLLHQAFKKHIAVSATIVLLSLGASNANADGVHDMCVDSPKICECAARKLNAEVGDASYALYEVIGTDYLANKKTDMNMVEAWDAAVKSAAGRQGKGFTDTLNKTNKIGSAHREAIEACKGG